MKLQSPPPSGLAQQRWLPTTSRHNESSYSIYITALAALSSFLSLRSLLDRDIHRGGYLGLYGGYIPGKIPRSFILVLRYCCLARSMGLACAGWRVVIDWWAVRRLVFVVCKHLRDCAQGSKDDREGD